MPVLEVRAVLSMPPVLPHDLHLDGLVMAHHPDLAGGHIHRASPRESIALPRIAIPHLLQSGVPVYLASAQIVPAGAYVAREHAVKRKDAIDIEERAQRWMPAGGPDKNCMKPLKLLMTPYLAWLCVGRARPVRQLLDFVQQVGAWRSAGYGTVEKWIVTERTDLHPADVLVQNGVAMRHLPATWCESGTFDRGTVSPPYWHAYSSGLRVRAGNAAQLTADLLRRLESIR